MKKITQNFTNVKVWQSIMVAFIFLLSLTTFSQTCPTDKFDQDPVVGDQLGENVMVQATSMSKSVVATIPWSNSLEDSADPQGDLGTAQTGPSTNYNWTISTGHFTHNVGDDGLQGDGGNNYLQHDDIDGNSGNFENWVLTPTFDLSGATSPELNYWEHVHWQSYAVAHLVMYSTDYVDNGSTSDTSDVTTATWVVLNSAIFDNVNYDQFYTGCGCDPTNVWGEGTFALPTDAAVTVAFKYVGDYASDWLIDDISVKDTAAAAADWDVTGAVTGSATLSISVDNFTVGDNTGTAPDDGHWHYTVDGGSAVMVYDTNDVALTGLANGEHTVVAWLVDNNHAALNPAVEETITFTSFDGFYTGSYPYCSSFDADLDNWATSIYSGSINWEGGATANISTAVTPLSGAGMAIFYSGNYNGDIASITSPSMDLTGLTNPQVTFSYTQQAWAGDQDELRVFYRDGAGGTWVELAAYTSEVTAWTEVTLSLPNTSADYYIGFQGYSGYGYGITVDDVCVDGDAAVSNTVLADPTLGWLGYMNVFDLTGGAQGGYLWGSAWGVPDVATTLNTNTDYMTITLEPNYNAYADNPGDAYWQDGSGGGAKWMEGSTYVESATDWNGADLTFTGYVYHHSLATDWTANFFIKALDPNNGYADALAGAYVTALPTDGVFSVTVPAGELSAGFVVQAGFAVNGPNANPDNQTANGKVILGGDADAPMSIDDVNVLDMRIYPNPVDGNYVTILSPVNGTKYVQVFDINGRRVMDTSINNNTLDVSSINSGFYMIKVTIDGQSKISKLVVR